MVSASLRQTGELVEAAAARGGVESPEAHLSRQPLKLDSKAFKDLSKKARELYDYGLQVQKEADKRRKDSDHLDEVDAARSTMLFTAPPVDEAQPQTEDEGVHTRASTSRWRPSRGTKPSR